MDARLIVEPELAARAAERATPETIAGLRECLSRMQAGGADHASLIHSDLIREDLRFHRLIFQMADNRVCSLMFSIVHELLHDLMEITSQMVALDHTVKLHSRIFNAIRRHDAGAARARMFAHLTDARGLLLKSHEAHRQSKMEHRFSKLSVPR
jgi:GntR family transcriptional repressor for pyruvate dehydrogenase complex